MSQDLLGTLLQALRRRWLVFVLVAVPLALGAVRYVETLPDRYEGRAVVSFAPEGATSADVVSLLLPKYQEYVTSDDTLASVAGQLGEPIEAVDRDIAITIPSGTSNLEITAERDSPAPAADTANALAAAAVAFSGMDELVEGTVISRALPPREASGPPRRLIEVAAVLVALVLGGALAVLAEHLRPRARTVREISQEAGLPVVGSLPFSSSVDLTAPEALADPEIGAQVRILRTNLAQAGRARPFTAVVVTSAARGGGKTTVASLFAAAAALPDERVLLVDGDLLRSSVAARIGVPASPGLAELLRGDGSLEQSLYSDTIVGLSVLPTLPADDAGDLVARRFGELLADLRERYDLIVIDAPPLEGNDLARQLATVADAVLLVIPAGAPLAQITAAAAVLRELEVRVLGVVANGVSSRLGTSYVRSG